MIIKSISIRNFKSFGNNTQKINFKINEGELILLTGNNGSGKCISPDTQIDISIDDEKIMDLLLKFLEKRKKPL